jgi:hypothetical protein
MRKASYEWPELNALIGLAEQQRHQSFMSIHQKYLTPALPLLYRLGTNLLTTSINQTEF